MLGFEVCRPFGFAVSRGPEILITGAGGGVLSRELRRSCARGLSNNLMVGLPSTAWESVPLVFSFLSNASKLVTEDDLDGL